MEVLIKRERVTTKMNNQTKTKTKITYLKESLTVLAQV